MKMRTPEDKIRKVEEESKFILALRGIDDKAIEVRNPRVIQFIANEMSLLGHKFFKKTVKTHSVLDEKGGIISKGLNNFSSHD